jgi:hypothetical protein
MQNRKTATGAQITPRIVPIAAVRARSGAAQRALVAPGP